MILIIAEVRVRDYGFSTARQEDLWGRWRGGESLGGIARSMGAQLQHVRRFLLQTGGLKSPPRCRSLRHLAGEEREEISRGIAAGRSARAIARGLGRPASTVSREIARNGGREGCRAGAADAAAEVRARPKQAKLAGRPDLRVMVEELLGRRWSPQQISGRLRLDFPDDRAMWVSHETIYLALFDPRRRAINRQLSRRLRTGRLMRLPRKARQPSGRGRIRDMLPIGQRPPEVDDRKIDGHWEGDLVMGTRPSAIATLVERTSRLVRLVALPDGIKAHQVRPHLTHAALQIPPHLRRTLTWDRGREMAEHALFTADTAMPAYFCKRLRLKWREPSSTGACLPLP